MTIIKNEIAQLYFMLVSRHSFKKRNQVYQSRLPSIAEICPSWHKRLEQVPVARISLNWISWRNQMQCAETCIVGEAHRFSSSYKDECGQCLADSQQFLNMYEKESYRELNQGVNDFAGHFCRCHGGSAENSPKRRQLKWFDSFFRFDDSMFVYQYRSARE